MARLRLAAFLLVLVLLAVPAGRQPVESYQETNRLQGTWQITAVQRNGHADPTQLGQLLTFDRDSVVFSPTMRVVPFDEQTLPSAVGQKDVVASNLALD